MVFSGPSISSQRSLSTASFHQTKKKNFRAAHPNATRLASSGSGEVLLHPLALTLTSLSFCTTEYPDLLPSPTAVWATLRTGHTYNTLSNPSTRPHHQPCLRTATLTMTCLWRGPTATTVSGPAHPNPFHSATRHLDHLPPCSLIVASKAFVAHLANRCRWFCEVSASKISKAEDEAMDGSVPKPQPSAAGISIRNGPIDDDSMDIDQPNGTAKRKSRASINNNVSYKDQSESDDEIPLVRSCTVETLDLWNAIKPLFHMCAFWLTYYPGQTPQESPQAER